MRGFIAVMLVALAFGAPADANSTTAVDIVGAAGRTADELVLVGSGGEIYKRSGAGWKRAAGGGTASTLVHARGVLPTEIWGMAASAPPYKHDGSTWSAPAFPISGAGVMGHSGALSVAVQRRVQVWSGGKWVQLPTTGVLGMVAVWASGPKDAVVATSAGELKRFDGTAWKAITPVFPTAEERVIQLHTAGVSQVAAIGDRGSLMLVDKTAAKLATLETRLGSFQGRAGAQGPGGKLYLVGAAKVSGQDRQALVKLDAGKLVLVDTTPALAAGDEIVALIVATDGAATVVTRRGAVHMRAAAGGWTSATVDNTLASEDHGTNPPAQVSP